MLELEQDYHFDLTLIVLFLLGADIQISPDFFFSNILCQPKRVLISNAGSLKSVPPAYDNEVEGIFSYCVFELYGAK